MTDSGKARIWEELAKLESMRLPHVLVTLTGVDGSAPQDAGARMLVTPDSRVTGTVGGGKVEAAALKHAQALLQGTHDATDEVEWNLQQDIGMTCGGRVRMFFHARFVRTWTVAIFGAGHIAQELIRVLLPLKLNLHCSDPRPEWTGKLPSAPHLRVNTTSAMAGIVDALPSGTSVVCMSQGHATDLPILQRAFERDCFPFIGCIGSDVKAKKLKKELIEHGISEAKTHSLHCPVGLPIGNNDPCEIAISIAAQLLKER